MKVGIIGIGHVGTSVALSILQAGITHEVLLYDIDLAKAEGEAMDLAQGALFYSSASVRTASMEEIAKADVVVFAAGRNMAGREKLASTSSTTTSRSSGWQAVNSAVAKRPSWSSRTPWMCSPKS